MLDGYYCFVFGNFVVRFEVIICCGNLLNLFYSFFVITIKGTIIIEWEAKILGVFR